MKKYYIRTYMGGFIEVTKTQFNKFINEFNIGSVMDHDDYGYTCSDIYKLDNIMVAYMVYEVCCDV